MKWFTTALIALSQFLFAGLGSASEFPSREIKVIVPLAPGGGTDTVTRQLTERMASEIGQPMIIDNKGGAGTTIGMAAAAGAAPTGYTLVVNGDTAAIFEYIFANLKFDTMKDFVPVAYFASAPIVLAAHPSFAPGNVKELIELAKKEPGKINYATPGVGTPHDLAGLLLMQKAGVKFNEVAYRGNGPALTDLLAGHVQIGMFTLTNVLPYVQSGKLKVLAVVGDRRTPLAPDFPSMAQSGLAGVDVSARYVLLAPKGTPEPVITKLHAAVVSAVKKPETVAAFKKMGYEPMSVSQQEAVNLMKAEHDRWEPILKAANIKPQ